MSVNLERDFAKLSDRLKSSRAVEVPLRCLESEEETFVYGLISKSLSYIDSVHLNGTVQLVVSELLKNAEKAVLKRLFFEKGNRSPAAVDSQHSFGHTYKNDLKSLRSEAKKGKPRVTFEAKIENETVSLRVINDGPPFDHEEKYIRERILAGNGYDSLQALSNLSLHTLEGQGAGIAISILALKKAGLSPALLQWKATSSQTIFELSVQKNEVTADVLSRVEKGILAEVESLPAFPENIQKMMDLCNSSDSSARQIADEIGRDPAIAGQIIKLANSGGFAGGRVSELTEAVKILGVQNISNLLYRIGAFRILELRYGPSEDFLKHPIKVGYYSRMLARNFRLSSLADEAYVGGLLHDIGKIVLFHSMQNREAYELYADRRDRRSQVNLEELSSGISHALLGALLGKKWNFPPDLIAAIEYHHTPHSAPASYMKLVYLVYFANAVCDFQDGREHFFAIEPDVLAFFNITTDQAFDMIAATLLSSFQAAS